MAQRAITKTLGRFQCDELLGSDGTMETYRARVQGLAGFDRVFAVKCIPGGAALPRQDSAQRFLEAARRTAALKDPRVAQVVDTNVSDGTVFLATEFVHGASVLALRELAGTAHAGSPVAAPANWFSLVAQIGTEASRALAAAHAMQPPLVHGALSPANIRITPRGSVKLIDFGLREAVHGAGGVGADPDRWPYAAPELVMSGTVSAAVDLYALGAILFELATGEVFPPASEAEATGHALTRLAGVPKALGQTIEALLDPNAGERPGATKAAAILRATIAGTSEADLRAELGALVQRISLPKGQSAQYDAVKTGAGSDDDDDGDAVVMAGSAKPMVPVPAGARRTGGNPIVPPPVPSPKSSDTMFSAPQVTAVDTHESLATIPISLDGVPKAEMPAFNSAEVAAIFPPEMQGGAPPAGDAPAPRRRPATVEQHGFAAFTEEAEPEPLTDESDMGHLPALPHGERSSRRVVPVAAPIVPQPQEDAAAAPVRTPLPRLWIVAAGVATLTLLGGIAGFELGMRRQKQIFTQYAVPEPPVARQTAPAPLPRKPAPARIPLPPPAATQPEPQTASAAVAPPPAPKTTAPSAPPLAVAARPHESASPISSEFSISTIPPGATVWLGDREVGQTPVRVPAPPGGGQIILIKAGFRTVKIPFKSNASARINRGLTAAILPPSGGAAVKVMCKTVGKFPVSVDGAETGLLCPIARLPLPAGPHEISVYVPAKDESHRWKLQVRSGPPRLVGFKI